MSEEMLPQVVSLMSLGQIWGKLDESWRNWLEEHEEDDIDRPLPKANRGSWFCPVVGKEDAEIVRRIIIEEEIQTVYDMGAGDLRLSYWLAEQGFHVVAYETMPDQPERARSVLGEPTFRVRRKDYYRDFPKLAAGGGFDLFCFFGGANKAPFIPRRGHVIQGYWEVGTRYWKNGKLVRQW